MACESLSVQNFKFYTVSLVIFILLYILFTFCEFGCNKRYGKMSADFSCPLCISIIPCNLSVFSSGSITVTAAGDQLQRGAHDGGEAKTVLADADAS
jgi:hypothetical protein